MENALVQEFPERLKIFAKNAEIIRHENILIKEEQGEGAEVRLLPFSALSEC